MSALIIGIPIIVAAVVVLSEPEIIAVAKDLINWLVKTTNYNSDQIVQIINLYF